MKKFLTFVFFFLLFIAGFCQKVVTLSDVLKPDSLTVGENRIYVTESATVYIYDLKSFKLLGKFGKKGEGPGEFRVRGRGRMGGRGGAAITITEQKDKLLINNSNKILFFSKEGKYLNEMKLSSGFGASIMPLKDGFVIRSITGFGRRGGGGEPTRSLTIYNAKLKPIKDIYKTKLNFRMGRGRGTTRFNPLSNNFRRGGLVAENDRIYTFDTEKFVIQVYNSSGDKVTTISPKVKPVELTTERQAKLMSYFKNVLYKDFWSRVKDRIGLPKEFPAIQTFFATGEKLYVQTHRKKPGNSEFFIFDKNGKQLNKLLIPLAEENVLTYYPYCLKNSKVYQIIEDEDEEEYRLHITDF